MADSVGDDWERLAPEVPFLPTTGLASLASIARLASLLKKRETRVNY